MFAEVGGQVHITEVFVPEIVALHDVPIVAHDHLRIQTASGLDRSGEKRSGKAVDRRLSRVPVAKGVFGGGEESEPFRNEFVATARLDQGVDNKSGHLDLARRAAATSASPRSPVRIPLLLSITGRLRCRCQLSQ